MEMQQRNKHYLRRQFLRAMVTGLLGVALIFVVVFLFVNLTKPNNPGVVFDGIKPFFIMMGLIPPLIYYLELPLSVSLSQTRGTFLKNFLTMTVLSMISVGPVIEVAEWLWARLIHLTRGLGYSSYQFSGVELLGNILLLLAIAFYVTALVAAFFIEQQRQRPKWLSGILFGLGFATYFVFTSIWRIDIPVGIVSLGSILAPAVGLIVGLVGVLKNTRLIEPGKR